MKLRSGFLTPSRHMLRDSISMASTGDFSESLRSGKWSGTKLTLKTHICLILHVVGLFMQVSILTFKTQALGISAIGLGILDTTFAILQLIGGPLFGRYGDIFGGRSAMALALGCASFCYFITGLANTYALLFLSRIPAIFMHANQACQMIITDITVPSSRADALGKLGISFGIGMIIGPFLGGQVTQHFGEEYAAYIASTVVAIALIFSWKNIPKYSKSQTPEETSEKKASAILSLSKWKELLKKPGVFQLLLVKGISGIPFGAFQAMSSLIFIQEFGLQPQQVGMVLSYIGLVIMFIQGFGLGFLTKRFSETTLIKWSNFVLIWSWLLFAFMQNIWQFCIVMIPQAFGLSMQNVVISSVLTKRVSQADTGALLGLNAAVHSIVRTLSPTLGGFALTNFGFYYIGYAGSLISLCMTLYLFSKLDDVS